MHEASVEVNENAYALRSLTDMVTGNEMSPAESDDAIRYAYTFGGHKFLKETELEGETPEVRLYLGGAEFVNGQPESYYHGEGRVALTDSVPRFQYKLTDHLGNTMVLFEDKDGDGIITTESMSSDPLAVEVLQRNFYYAFGLPMQGPWNHTPTDPAMPYLYNGKELEGELGLGWYAYGFRYYDASVGRFVGVDPLAENHYGVTPYHYVLNSPLLFIDPFGLDTSFADVKTKDLFNSIYANITSNIETLSKKIGELEVKGKADSRRANKRRARKEGLEEVKLSFDEVIASETTFRYELLDSRGYNIFQGGGTTLSEDGTVNITIKESVENWRNERTLVHETRHGYGYLLREWSWDFNLKQPTYYDYMDEFVAIRYENWYMSAVHNHAVWKDDRIRERVIRDYQGNHVIKEFTQFLVP
jgi:RHS repeat-associated protein